MYDSDIITKASYMFYNFSWFDKFYNNIKYYFLFAIYLRHFLRMWMRINVCRNQWWSSSVMKQDIWLDTIYCFLVWHLLLIWQISWFTTRGRYYSSVMGSDKNKKKRACRRNNRTNKQVNQRKKPVKNDGVMWMKMTGQWWRIVAGKLKMSKMIQKH